MKLEYSRHCYTDHETRMNRVHEIGFGRIVGALRVSEREIRYATSTGLIIVNNPTKNTKSTLFVVTVEIAREAQYRRICEPSADVLQMIASHIANGDNKL